MSKAEKYLPFILALATPLLGAINNVDITVSEQWNEMLFRFIEASIIILIIWYLNQWLLYSENQIKNSLGLVAYTILGNAIVITLISLLDFFIIPRGFGADLPIWTPATRIALASLIFNVILRVFKSQKERSKLELQNLSLQAENLKFQIETFKQQVNPHFLFNSLNTLLDLIEEDKDRAVKYVRNFSNLYRIVLQSSKHDFVTLTDELKFLDDYWNLLKVRFNDSIDMEIKIDHDKTNYLIPPLSLQFLVENAVKHNEATKGDPLLIEIIGDNDSLIVKNRVKPKSYPVDSEKVGLKNLQQRFGLLYKPVEYGIEDDYFTVRIPLKAS
ncbi:MAG: histidine kinase [Bacteroidota bacterium]